MYERTGSAGLQSLSWNGRVWTGQKHSRACHSATLSANHQDWFYWSSATRNICRSRCNIQSCAHRNRYRMRLFPRYTWADWDKIDDMLCRLGVVMEPTDLLYLWVDQLCIDQKSEEDKKVEIGRMRDYYAQAAVTDVMVPEWSTTFTWELAGSKASYQEAIKATTDVGALKNTVWGSRVWTMQEALLSRRTVFVGESEIRSAVELTIALNPKWLEGSEDGHPRGVWVNSKTHNYVYFEMKTAAAGYGFMPVRASPLLRDMVVLQTRYDVTEYDYLDDVWRISGDRQCSKEEDRVYGMLGLPRRGGTVDAEYGIGFEEAVRRAAAKGLVSSGVLLASISSQKPGRSWCPGPGTESRFRRTDRRRWDGITLMQPIQLASEGQCIVHAARFQMSSKPEIATKYTSKCWCKDLEGSGEFELKFDCEVPEGEEWRGDWLAVVELEKNRHGATLIKYATTGGKLFKLDSLEAGIWP